MDSELVPFHVLHRDPASQGVPYSVLFYGSFLQSKGLDVLLKAMLTLPPESPPIKLVISGNGRMPQDWVKLIGEVRKRFEVSVINFASRQEGDAAFANSSVVALPYKTGSQSSVLFSAYGFLKPVVATAVGLMHEVVEDGKTGYLVPAGDSGESGARLIEILTNDALRERMGSRIAEVNRTLYNVDAVAERHISVYEKAAKH